MDDGSFFICTNGTRLRVDAAVYARGHALTWNESPDGGHRARIGDALVTLGRFALRVTDPAARVYRVNTRRLRDNAGEYLDYRSENLVIRQPGQGRPPIGIEAATDWKARALAAEAELAALKGAA